MLYVICYIMFSPIKYLLNTTCQEIVETPAMKTHDNNSNWNNYLLRYFIIHCYSFTSAYL